MGVWVVVYTHWVGLFVCVSHMYVVNLYWCLQYVCLHSGGLGVGGWGGVTFLCSTFEPLCIITNYFLSDKANT